MWTNKVSIGRSQNCWPCNRYERGGPENPMTTESLELLGSKGTQGRGHRFCNDVAINVVFAAKNIGLIVLFPKP